MPDIDPRMRTVMERYFDTELDASLLLQTMTVKLKGGQWLFHQGDRGDALYLVVRGRLQALMGPQGTREGQDEDLVLLGEMVADQSVGELGLISGEPRAAGIRAIRDSVLIRIDQDSFQRLAHKHPSLTIKLAANVAGMLQKNLRGGESANRKFRTISILPLHDSREARALCRELARRLRDKAEAMVLQPDRLSRYGAPGNATTLEPDLPTNVQDWVNDQEYEYPLVVFACEGDESAWTRFALRQSDLVVLVAEAGADPSLTGMELDLLMGENAPAGRRMLVLMHGVGEEIRGTAKWLQGRPVDYHLHYRAGGGNDLERIQRIIAGTGVGLVLSAGAVRGVAQLGVYKALHEAGVRVDWVGGTSIGAIIAAAIAKEWRPDQAIAMARDAFVDGKPFSDVTIPVISLLRGQRLKELLKTHMDMDIEDLPLPYFCISSNLDRGVENVHERGSLSAAIAASTAFPGVMPPAVVNRELAVDGSVLNILPVDVMQRRPVGEIIAVDVTSYTERKVDYVETPSPWSVLWRRWFPFGDRYHVPSLAAIVLESTEIGARFEAGRRGAGANLLLSPPVRQFDMTNFKAFDQLVEAGYEYACAELERRRAKG